MPWRKWRHCERFSTLNWHQGKWWTIGGMYRVWRHMYSLIHISPLPNLLVCLSVSMHSCCGRYLLCYIIPLWLPFVLCSYVSTQKDDNGRVRSTKVTTAWFLRSFDARLAKQDWVGPHPGPHLEVFLRHWTHKETARERQWEQQHAKRGGGGGVVPNKQYRQIQWQPWPNFNHAAERLVFFRRCTVFFCLFVFS